jgi:hypothetical protein
MNDLVPCPDCSRHLRRTEASCPFCGANVADAVGGAPVRQLPTTRLGRVALFTFAAASIGTAACGGDDGEPGPGTGGAGTGAAGGRSGMGGQSATDTGGKQNASGGRNQGGGAMALYGAAPVGGRDGTGGGVGTLYGLPGPNQ